jgi:hypothetical protein
MRKLVCGSLIIIFSGFFLLLFSCTPQSCFEETESFLKASFYTSVNNNTTKIVAPDSLTIYGLNMDSIIYKQTRKVQPALIPLNPATDKCVFIIMINGIADTVEFRYSSYPHLLSKECGYTYYHNLDTDRIFTKHKIINIYYSKRNITTINEENIRIFY